MVFTPLMSSARGRLTHLWAPGCLCACCALLCILSCDLKKINAVAYIPPASEFRDTGLSGASLWPSWYTAMRREALVCWHNANPPPSPASIQHQVLETHKTLRPGPAALQAEKAWAVFIHNGVTVEGWAARDSEACCWGWLLGGVGGI